MRKALENIALLLFNTAVLVFILIPIGVILGAYRGGLERMLSVWNSYCEILDMKTQNMLIKKGGE